MNYACCDFATAPGPQTDPVEMSAGAAVKAAGLPWNGRAQMFMQGYRHAARERTELLNKFLGSEPDYDAGAAAARVA